MNLTQKVILASASPRRRELLKCIIPEFETFPADVDESVPPEVSPEAAAEYLAVKKAGRVAGLFPSDLVIGCDTAVILGGEVFGKPAGEADAERMLRALSGKTHAVITGVCAFSAGRSVSFSELTEVTFYPLTDAEILSYVKTGDPLDKAGAYGIQSSAGRLLVKKINGDFFNVIGLPAARLKRVLEKLYGNQV